MTEQGGVTILNADGTVRATTTLAGGPHKTPSAVDTGDGTVFLAGEAKTVRAWPNGTLKWAYTGATEKFKAGVAWAASGTVYAVDEKRNVYALNSLTGQLRWKRAAGGSGVVYATPVLAPDGTLYVLSDQGYLFAINPTGTVKWQFIASAGAPFTQHWWSARTAPSTSSARRRLSWPSPRLR